MSDEKVMLIMKNLSLLAKAKKKPITLSQQMVFLKMYEYATSKNVTVPLSFTMPDDVMAQKAGESKRSFMQAVQALEGIGAITREATQGKTRRKGQAPVLTVLNPEVYAG